MRSSKGPAPAISQHSFRYGDETIVFALRRQPERKVQRVAIHVEPDGTVVVDAPEDASDALALAAVKKRARWISEHVNAVRIRLAHVLPREYVSGESLMYLGRRYRLKVLIDPEVASTVASRSASQVASQVASHSQLAPRARMRGGYIEVLASPRAPELIRAALDTWFRHRASVVFAERLLAVAAPLCWVAQVPPMRLQSMKVQWGSCSPAGRITLNPLLVKAPRECIDYVVLHELCHLHHHNHSRRFYKELDCHMPGWRAIKERLDEMAEQVLRA